MHKRNAVRAALRGKRVAIAVAAAFVPLGEAYSLPTGEQLVHGQVSVTRPDAVTMQINQGTPKGIVNWTGFSINGNEHVNITQPSSSASLLNRVVGNDPSNIFGRLTANGQVFLVNNAGVFFAPGASVNAAAIVASTLSITDQSFLDNTYQFFNPGNAGSVVNQGSIVTAGGFTALIGPQVRNDGIILANSGKIALSAGNRVSLDMIGDGLVSISVDEAAFNASVINTGTLQADGGAVFLKASSANALLDTVINTSGVIRASGLGLENGVIVLHGGDAGTVQVSGLVQSESGRIEISAGGGLNVGSTVCCSPTTVIAATEDIRAGSVTVGGGAQIVGNTGAGSQTITTPGTLLVRGGTVSGNVGIFHNGTGEQRVTAGNVEVRGGIGTNTAAFINSTGGGDQTLTVTGELRVTGGASGTGNRAGIVSTANQTINGNPDIVLTGGAGGGAGNASNNVFIQATGPDTTQQTINARTIELRSGAGIDASATLNAARQVIGTLGNVSVIGGAGLGGSNGARIGGIGGTTLGPTNLTLTVGGNLLLHGGTLNGASLGSSGASTQANTIAVSAVGDITLASDGAGARIGSSNQTPVPPGNITVSAGENFVIGAGTAVRANGPISLTANSLTNDGTITNGGGTANMLLSANAYALAGGNIQGGNAAVLLRPRDGTRSLGIEAAGDTTLTNADIASINTSNFVVFGSGMGTIFTGNMAIGENAQVQGGGKHLAFFRSTVPGGTTTIGSQGLATTGDVIVSAGGGAIVSNGGTVAGDEVQLRASQGIGTSFARVSTAANALAINNTGVAGSFVSDAHGVTLRTVSLNVGGNQNTFGTLTGGALDLDVGGVLNVAGVVQSGGTMSINAVGTLNVIGAGTQDGMLISSGGQTITAHSVNLTAQDGRRANIENNGGNQSVAAMGDMNLQVPGAFGVAQIINTAPGGNQTITASGQLNVLGGANTSGSTNSGIFKNGAGGLQTVRASGITLQGANTGTRAGALISSQGDQVIDVTGGNISIFGGNGGNLNNAAILASAAGQQTIRAHDINLANGFGGIDTVAGIQAGHQLIEATGNVTLTSQGAILGTAAGGPGVRIGAPQNTPAGSDITLRVGGSLTLNGGTVAENGAAIGSSGAGVAAPNTIFIDAGGNVILNAGTEPNTGVRIGSGSNGTAGGNISIQAAGGIELNGTQRSAAIRTTDNVTLQAASISEQGNGFILANALTTTTSGATNLAGPNQVSSYSGSTSFFGSDLTLNNSGPLTITSLNAGGNLALTNTGNVNVTGLSSSFGSMNVATTGGNLMLTSSLSSGNAMTLDIGGTLTLSANGPQTAQLIANSGGQTIRAQAVDVVAQNGGFASIINSPGSGEQRITVSGGGTSAGLDVRTLASGGSARIDQNASGFAQTIEVSDADHIRVNGAGPGNAAIFAQGAQTVSISGSGANAIEVGSVGARGSSNVGSLSSQNVTAGLAGEQGSIVIVGSDAASSAANINAGSSAGATQTVSTSGTISITGGRASAGAFSPGIFHNGSGQQTVNAAAIVLTGGSSGNNNGALISVTGAGNPNNAGAQVVNVSGDLTIIGGPGGNAGIQGSASRQQTIHAHDITVMNSAGGGNNSVGFIQGGLQDIHATGNVTLTARASGGGVGGPGVRIGGLAPNTGTGFPGTPTDLDLFVGGNLVLNGGTAVNNAVAIGSSSAGAGQPNEIFIQAGGNVILNSGTLAGTGARIGSAQTTATTPGSIEIRAGGAIELNGVAETTAIRTLGNVTLMAGSINEASNGFVIANTLTTTSTAGNSNLTGPNQVSNFNGTSSANLSLANTGALNVTGVNAGGDASVDNVGNVTVSGPWISGGTSTITVHSDIVLNSVLTSANVRLTADGSIIETPGLGAVVADTLTTISGGNTTLAGENRVASYSGTSAADLFLFNRGALNVTDVSAVNGNLSVDGTITLSGPWTTSGRTTLTAGGSLLEAPGGFIQAGGGADLFAQQSIDLNGPNQITGTLSAMSMQGNVRLTNSGDVSFAGTAQTGSLAFTNSGNLNVRSMSATGGDATLINIGDVNFTGSSFSSGSMNITTIGGDLTLTSMGSGPAVANTTSSGGAMTLTIGGDLTLASTSGGLTSQVIMNSGAAMTANVDGTLTVSANGPQTVALMIANNGGQTITAQSVEVVAQNGGFAQIFNSGAGDQQIKILGGGTGAGLDVHTLPSGGFAQISQQAAGFAQTIEVIGADHINVNGEGGGASIFALGGPQTLSITGSGANAIRIGSLGARSFSTVAGAVNQNVTAGLEGQHGSITIVGADVSQASASLGTNTAAGGTQTVSTSGAIDITGGRALTNAFAPGIFHNGSGQQTINAASISLTGGASGNTNAALINAGGGGNAAIGGAQVINVTGDITIAGGPGGTAGIFGSATRQQTIHAHNISLTNSESGNNIAGIIQGGHQEIHATGNVTLTARGAGGDLSGVRIGGSSGTVVTATDLQLFVGGDLVLQGGTAVNNGASLGSTGAPGGVALANDITINAGGSVILNAGTLAGTGARIGGALTPTGAPGSIDITAGGGIELNGVAQPTAIRTLGTVTLTAHHITEASNGFILAGTLNTTTHGNQLLTGPNQVASFTASTTSGNVSLTNAAPGLTLGSMELPGSLTIDQTGTLSIPGTVSALSHVIDATGDVLVGSAGATNAALLYASGDISIETPGSVIVRGSDVTHLAASAVLADGNLQVAAGNVTIQGGGALLTPAAMRGEAVDISAANELRVKGGSGHLSPALLSSGSNINLTIGDAVRVDAGSGLFSFARIQTEIKNGVIHISFPDLARGGYFVNGVEGRTHQGETGFFTLNKPAKLGKTLLVEYGAP